MFSQFFDTQSILLIQMSTFTGCFQWKQKLWKGIAPAGPASDPSETDCGLDQCVQCASRFFHEQLTVLRCISKSGVLGC